MDDYENKQRMITMDSRQLCSIRMLLRYFLIRKILGRKKSTAGNCIAAKGCTRILERAEILKRWTEKSASYSQEKEMQQEHGSSGNAILEEEVCNAIAML